MPLIVTLPNGVEVEISGTGTATLVNPDPPPPPPPPPPTGLPAETGVEFTPTMTANNLPSGSVASATSEYDDNCQAYKALDKGSGPSYTNGWSSAAQASASVPQVWSLKLPVAKACYKYSIKSRTDTGNNSPRAWIVKAADGSIIHQVTSLSPWSAGEVKTFTVTTPVLSDRFSFHFTASGPLCQVDELRLFG
jgi:hypothetical protein